MKKEKTLSKNRLQNFHHEKKEKFRDGNKKDARAKKKN